MAEPTGVHESEEQFEIERHNRLYREQRPADLRMVPGDWERFETMTQPIDAYNASVLELGDIRGRNVLDMGCGDGWLSVILAKRGGIIWGYDISAEAIETARRRAAANDVADRTHFDVASAYTTPYPDRHFDVVIGQAILHHLGDKEALGRELIRVMKPGARAVFCEPFAASRTLRRLRRVVPIESEAADDPDQEQLTYRDFEVFSNQFDVRAQEYQLFSRLDRVFRSRGARQFLGKLDLVLLKWVPPLRRFARTVVVTLTPRASR
jgi:ubiquinone/menaquinone biosynthesis C-methylase UbiE